MAKKKSIYTETDASQSRSKKKGQGNAAGVGIPTLMAAAKGLREAGKNPIGPITRAAAKLGGQEFGKDLAARNSRMPAGARGSKAADYMRGGISEYTQMGDNMSRAKSAKSSARTHGTAQKIDSTSKAIERNKGFSNKAPSDGFNEYSAKAGQRNPDGSRSFRVKGTFNIPEVEKRLGMKVRTSSGGGGVGRGGARVEGRIGGAGGGEGGILGRKKGVR
jgi:hypothetical protein